MGRSADDKSARFAEASQHSQDVPAPPRVGAEYSPDAERSAGCSGATPRAADSLRELHLFAGAGGGILGGMLLGHTPVCAVEIDKYCRRVLEARQADGCLPPFPVFADIREFDGKPWRGLVDVVAGGFPCQPWSQAGKHKGADDPRHLWPEMARIVEEVRPTYVFAENVSLAALEEPWRDLRGLGYRVPPAFCVAASDVGAPHIRKRWWLLAYAEGQPERPGLQPGEPGEVRGRRPGDGGRAVSDADSGRRQEQRKPKPTRQQGARGDEPDGLRAGVELDPAPADSDRGALRDDQQRDGRQGPGLQDQGHPQFGHDGVSRAVADADDAGLEQQRRPIAGRAEYAPTELCSWWQAEPPVGRVVDGMANRVGQLRALGNGQVPMAAATAWHYLMEQLRS
jgi:DNA (cytosine-5)-methyltransferase 1